MVIVEVAWEGTATYFHEGVKSVNAATPWVEDLSTKLSGLYSSAISEQTESFV